MANYYFLISAFPPLVLGNRPEIAFKELNDLLVLNLTAEDQSKAGELLRPIDLYNIRAFWLGQRLDDRGQIEAKELEEDLLVHEGFPSYVIEYLERYESIEERLRNFSSLYVSMFSDLQLKLKGFLLKIFRLEREMRLVLTALRAKQVGRDLVRELQFEDFSDPLVMEILAQKDASIFTPPQEYEDLKTLFMENSSDPQNLNRVILEYRFHKIEEMEEPQDFGIDRVLAYVAKFLLVESLAMESKEKGMEQLESI